MSEGQWNATGKLKLHPPKRGPLPACILLIVQLDDMEPKRCKLLVWCG